MRQHVIVAAAALAFAGCATKPATVSDRDRLEQQADSTLGQMRAKDARVDQVLHGAYAYAVFPDVGKAGIGGAGGAFGRGILFEQGVPTGYVKIEQVSLGAELGGQKYAELLILRDQVQVDRLKQGELDLGANVSAVIVKKGAALSSDTLQGSTVFIMPRGGAMVEASIAGQRIEFVPAG